MAILNDTRIQLQQEGIEHLSDLLDFDKEALRQIAENLRRPGGRVPNPDPTTARGDTILTLLFVFGVKSQIHLRAATHIMRYYETIGREATAANMKWTTCIKSFTQHWKALEDRKAEADIPDVPKITKSLVVTKWTEAFADFLNRVMGIRSVPLSYIIHEHGTVPAVAPTLAILPCALLLQFGIFEHSNEGMFVCIFLSSDSGS